MSVSRVAILALAAVGAIILLSTPRSAISQEIDRVFVTNFPAIQQIEGELTIAEPVPLAVERVTREVTVPPVHRGQTTRLVDAGTLVTNGFPGVVLSLHGVTKGEVAKSGAVGAVLVPDEPRVQDAFDEQGALHFALETVAPVVDATTPYFASQQRRFVVGFERYRVYLYNETDKTVTVDLYAYLSQ